MARVDPGRLAVTLRELRVTANKTLLDVTTETQISGAQVSRVEAGKRMPSPAHVDTLCRFYGADAELRAELIALAETVKASRRRVILSHPPGSEFQKRIGRLAANARVIRGFAPTIVPGAVQTPAYIAAIAEADGGTPEQVRAFVRSRLDNQPIFTDPAKQTTLLTTEGALGWTAGSPAVMVTQCEHIAERIIAGVNLGIIPFGAPALVFSACGFTAYDEDAVVPSITGVETVLNRPNVEDYLHEFELLQRMAVFGDAARAVLSRVADRYREFR